MKTSEIKPVTVKNIRIEKPQKIKEIKGQKQGIGGKAQFVSATLPEEKVQK